MNYQSIQKAEIIISAVGTDQYPVTDLPEIAVVGRSNVGKSSFINRILRRKKLARTSSKPGRTRTINFFNIEDEITLVDVPGYGYAKGSKKEQAKWADMMDEYFHLREPLEAVILLIDFRHGMTELDLQMYEFLKSVALPVIIVATKADKVRKSRWNANQSEIARQVQLTEEDSFVTFSSETGVGYDEVWQLMMGYLGIG